MKHKFVGAIATAAAIAFVTAPVTSTLAHACTKVTCYGVKAKNGCKGQGTTMMTTAKKCAKLGGTTTAPTGTTATPATPATPAAPTAAKQ